MNFVDNWRVKVNIQWTITNDTNESKANTKKGHPII